MYSLPSKRREILKGQYQFLQFMRFLKNRHNVVHCFLHFSLKDKIMGRGAGNYQEGNKVLTRRENN